MDNEITKEEFMALSSKEIASIVKKEGRPKVGVYLIDGTRRAGFLFYNLKPQSENFEKKLYNNINPLFLHQIKIILTHGLQTLFIPIFKHENLDRKKEWLDKAIENGVRPVFQGEKWLDFYNEYDIKVKIYGDLDYIKKCGYSKLVDWAMELEKNTSHHKTHRIYWGLACSNNFEQKRLFDLGINFYKEFGRHPNSDEKIKLYFGENVDEVDILIRSTEIRDSDLQPPIISGKKTQMYFLVAPNDISFNENVFKEILFDFLYCRTNIFGNRMYYDEDLENVDIKALQQYYELNKHLIIGIGNRIGKFWIPYLNIKIPKKLKKDKLNK